MQRLAARKFSQAKELAMRLAIAKEGMLLVCRGTRRLAHAMRSAVPHRTPPVECISLVTLEASPDARWKTA